MTQILSLTILSHNICQIVLSNVDIILVYNNVILLQMYAHCILFDNLALLLKSCVMDVTCRLPDVRWQEVESILYILSNVIDVSLSEGLCVVIHVCHHQCL